jgi:uncharacterized membrane protein
MGIVLKFLVFVLFFFLASFAGFAIYRVINKKIIESESQWQLLGFTVLLFLSLAILFIASLAVFIEVYRFLAVNS